MSKLKFGLVGAGGIAQAYAQAFNESECCELVAVADVRPEAAAALAEIAGGKAYGDYKQLADIKLDAVIVATPPSTHPEIACFFMELAKPVLCEKPLTTNLADAEKMIATAQKNNVLFTMASKFRYCDDVIKAKGILASGMLGDVLQFENAFTAKVDMSKRWNSDEAISGGGVLIDNGTHSVDIIRYFLGSIESVLVVDAGD
ncbi:MAG: Gfo/Idh/MocA family protein, partial [Pyrinomonadaceae bacterium]